MDLRVLVAGLTGVEPSEVWLEAQSQKVMVHVRRLAPCKRDVWLTPDDVPGDVLVVLADALARIQMNPNGLRTEQVGEYSYTRAGDSVGESVFTDDEVDIIRVAAACAESNVGGSAYSVRTTTTTPLVVGAADRAAAVRRSRGAR